MAWTDACKIEAVAQIDHKVEQGLSVRKALKELAGESGIPARTIERWKYPKKSVRKSADTKKEPKPFDELKARDRLCSILRKELQIFEEKNTVVLEAALWDVYRILAQEYNFKISEEE